MIKRIQNYTSLIIFLGSLFSFSLYGMEEQSLRATECSTVVALHPYKSITKTVVKKDRYGLYYTVITSAVPLKTEVSELMKKMPQLANLFKPSPLDYSGELRVIQKALGVQYPHNRQAGFELEKLGVLNHHIQGPSSREEYDTKVKDWITQAKNCRMLTPSDQEAWDKQCACAAEYIENPSDKLKLSEKERPYFFPQTGKPWSVAACAVMASRADQFVASARPVEEKSE